jgi:uncharacterized protein YcnI
VGIKVRAAAVAAVAAVAVAVVGAPTAASAHVTVSSDDATRGGEGVLTFRVPTESATASTTKLQVQLPTATPIASVLVQPTPGWTFRTVTTKLATPITNDDGDKVTAAVSEIDWSANSAATATKPGEFQQFVVSLGPLPDTATLKFGAIQTYSDGTVVKWIESPAPGSTVEPDHPAPVLTLAAATAGTAGTVGTAAKASPSKSSSNTGPIVLSVIALVVAAAALGYGFVSRAKGSRT